MKFTTPASCLIDALSIVTKALPSRTPNPVLESIMIETDHDEIVLTCSDERLTIVTRFTANVQEPGRGLVPGKLFAEIVRHLAGGELEIAMNDRFKFTICGLGSRMNIAGQDADLFPRLPKMEGAQSVSLPQSLLRGMIGKTEFAIAIEDMREILTGMYLEIENGVMTVVGMDGFRLALARDHSVSPDLNMKAIVPGRAMSDIGKLLSDDEEAFCTLSVGGGKLHIELGQTEMYVILIGGEYINYRQILPTVFGTRVTCNLEALKRSVDRAAIIARQDSNNLVILSIEPEQMNIEAHSQGGDAFEQLPIELDGQMMKIAFNVKYLTDVVRFMEGDEIVLNMNTSVRPCIVTPKDNGDYIHLVLPVRTGATV